MVKIRLIRTGKKHEPHYRIVAIDSTKKRQGRYIEKIGYYNPRTKPSTIEYDKDILEKWMKNGAQMTDTVHDIFVKEGVIKQTKLRTARIKARISGLKQKATEEKSQEPSTKEEKPKGEEKAPEDKENKKEGPEKKAEEKPDKPKEEKKDDKQETAEDSKN